MLIKVYFGLLISAQPLNSIKCAPYQIEFYTYTEDDTLLWTKLLLYIEIPMRVS